MNTISFEVVHLTAGLKREGFDSGVPALNTYLREQASQDVRRRVASCWLALTDAHQIAGFYTLASTSVLLNDLPTDVQKKLPRYPSVPAARMGRLAVDRRFQGLGLGAALLADALQRCLRSEVATFAMVVDAKDEVAAQFYIRHGFIALQAQALQYFLPLASARALLS